MVDKALRIWDELPEEPGFGQQHRIASFALGLFFVSWGTIESIIEVGIAKQLDLDPHRASIMTAGMMFGTRAAVLLALLRRDKSKNQTAIAHINTLRSMPDRNALAHGNIGSDDNGLVFTYRKVEGDYTSTEMPYSSQRLLELSVKISGLAVSLQKELGITDDARRDFFEKAHLAGGAKTG